MVVPKALKSPRRMASVATVPVRVRPADSWLPSQPTKKNSLFLTMGQARVAPLMLRLVLGLRPGEPSAFLGRKKFRARRCSLSLSAKSAPRKSLVPDLVITVTAAPPAIPCSASKLLVDTFTVSIVSAGETYIKWFGSQTFMFVAPSVRVELFVFACPLILVAIDRAGVSVSALPNAIGIVPGARLISAWKLRNRLSGIVVMVSASEL